MRNPVLVHSKNVAFQAVLITVFSGFYSYSMPAMSQDTLDTEDRLRAVANAVLKDATFQFIDQKSGQRFKSPKEAPLDAQLRPESPYTDWRYWNGVLNLAMIELGNVLQEPAFTEFAIKNAAFSFDNYRYFEDKYKGQGKWDYPFGQLFIMDELDDYGAMGASVIEVYRHDPQEQYRTYIEKVAKHILKRQDRLEDGTFVRSFPQKWTLWADDLYMSVSFLSRMGELSGDNRYFDEAVIQVINFYKYLFNEEKGLMYHNWYSDVNQPGVAFWGRANGWVLLAQVDLLDRLPENHPKHSQILELFQRHILGVARYQSAEGLWHQLLDKADSYLETSCSAMFTYVIARAVNKGYLKPRYASIAINGWEGVISKIRSDGQVKSVCTGTVVSDNLDYYYKRPTPLNDVHGIGAVLLAGAELLKLPK